MKAMVKDRMDRPSEGRCTKQNREQARGHLWEGNKKSGGCFIVTYLTVSSSAH
jgi:hypothetical protein